MCGIYRHCGNVINADNFWNFLNILLAFLATSQVRKGHGSKKKNLVFDFQYCEPNYALDNEGARRYFNLVGREQTEAEVRVRHINMKI